MATPIPPKTILTKREGKLDPAIAGRIALLAQLNRRHKAALGKRDRRALNRLAREYETIGCRQMAFKIRSEAEDIVPAKAKRR